MGKERGERSSSRAGVTKLFINLGELDKLDSRSMKEYISEVSGVDLASILSAEIKSSFSFIEVKTETAEIIQGTFKNVRYNNRNVRVESRGSSERSRENNGNGRSYGGGERRDRGSRFERGGNRSGDRNYRGDRKGFGSGERKSYSDRERSGSDRERAGRDSGGDRKSNFSREKRPRKQF
jgi:ATP-dependent RNA helicase DeaD